MEDLIWGHVNWRVFTLYLTNTEQCNISPSTSSLDAQCETSTVSSQWFWRTTADEHCDSEWCTCIF